MELIVLGGSVFQYNNLANANIIAHALGVQAMSLYINTGFSSFTMQLHYLSHLDLMALPEYTVVNLEFLKSFVDFSNG
ncbi:hypothetical protein [Candidatus Coxiella mudrowiae]|uniref:hypothetical protein n=1 Tax=Candidatus Coxiella mudrowiae TaxID=2054173 RepID=UPI00066257D0|nr:hypothetical protein [Candidatus Coxiella mudrowiae]